MCGVSDISGPGRGASSPVRRTSRNSEILWLFKAVFLLVYVIELQSKVEKQWR